ncbi:DUF3658 domain-containing protein [Polaromonas sp. CT11-55]|uniref:DUF3658 domain-containing protein n=1 Tax=Polaromonas sp. CT11-55 TaxID=3243045 RepID=UPI0039A5DA70
MNEDPVYDPDSAPYEPSDEEIAQMRAASPAEAAAVDALILRECSDRWQKVAKIVGDLIKEFDQSYPHLPFAYIQARMDELEDMGKVEIVGHVWSMRYSEIRLAPSPSDAT